MNINAREQLEAATEWLGWSNENLSFGLKNAEDGLKLWRHMIEDKGRELPEFADEWPEEVLVRILGYNPMDGDVRSGDVGDRIVRLPNESLARLRSGLTFPNPKLE
jgi:hypothetical protein